MFSAKKITVESGDFIATSKDYKNFLDYRKKKGAQTVGHSSLFDFEKMLLANWLHDRLMKCTWTDNYIAHVLCIAYEANLEVEGKVNSTSPELGLVAEMSQRIPQEWDRRLKDRIAKNEEKEKLSLSLPEKLNVVKTGTFTVSRLSKHICALYDYMCQKQKESFPPPKRGRDF